MNFQYKIRDRAGNIISGEREAPSRSALVKDLEGEGFRPIAVVPAAGGVKRERIVAAPRAPQEKRPPMAWALGRAVREEEVLIFTRDLLSLVRSAVPLVGGLSDLAAQVGNPAFRSTLESIVSDITAGNKLSEAIEKHPAVFSEFYCMSIRAGEQAGRLDDVLVRLAATLERDLDTRLAIQNAVRYPIVVLCVLVVAFGVMVTLVVPRMARLFASFNTPLPLPTRIILAVSSFSQRYGLLLAAAGAGLWVALHFYGKTPAGRRRIDAFKLRLPVFGELFRKVAIARFAVILQTLYASGVVLPEALKISAKVVGNGVIEQAVLRVQEGVLAGRTLSETLAESTLFPPFLTRVVMMGEKTGNLEEMLGEVVAHYDRDVGYMTRSMTTLIEPLLTVGLGLMVLVFALGVFMPMWSLIRLFRR